MHCLVVREMVHTADSDICIKFEWKDSFDLTQTEALVLDETGDTAVLLKSCAEKNSLDNFGKRQTRSDMCAQLPGELQ